MYINIYIYVLCNIKHYIILYIELNIKYIIYMYILRYIKLYIILYYIIFIIYVIYVCIIYEFYIFDTLKRYSLH